MKVYAANKDMVRLLKHPIAGGFTDMDTAVDWPDDSFTYRRLRDGDINDKPQAKKEAETPRTEAEAPRTEVASQAEAAPSVSESQPAPEATDAHDTSARRRK